MHWPCLSECSPFISVLSHFVFLFKLSFDDIAKHGSAFSNKESNGEFEYLKSNIKLSKSQYWTGVQINSGDWAWNLASGMGMHAKHIMNQEGRIINNIILYLYCRFIDLMDDDDIQGVIFVNLEHADFKSQGIVIWR